MAKVLDPLLEEDLKRITLVNLRKEYKKLSDFYKKIINGELVYCSHCGGWKTSTSFYSSSTSADGVEHYACKECILNDCTDYDKKTGVRTDNREKTINTFKALNWYFDEKAYNDQLQILSEGTAEKIRSTAVQQWIVICRSLNDYSNKSFADSIFVTSDENSDENDVKLIQKTIKNGRKRFGNYSNEDLMFLENQYQDWITRYECNSKAQEEIFERLSFKKWEISKATKQGLPTKDLDKTYQELLATANIQPRQTRMDTFADAQTMGTLIQKFEETRPLPEIDPELQDIDKIGLYIDSFYRGHASKMLGIKNKFSNLYEKVMSKYTVKPPEYDEESDSEDLFDKIFGSVEDY